MKQILSITRKELEGYFGSLMAIIFLGAFLFALLFIFFSVETFFARGIADVRPMFQWMPVLLIFLLAALTMRQWSEEQRSGTLEVLLTLPVSNLQLVLGKFLAVMTMILIALAMTLPLPIIVAALGNLDWGPVVGGYLAAVLMAAAYAAIGLFVSSRTDNQIVALISTVLLGGVFYLVGSSGVTNFVSGPVSEILWSLGTGSRFESIERGVIDLRDLVYYLSLTALFLMLNTISLDALRWSAKQTAYKWNQTRTAALIGVNLILLNVWLYPLQGLRADITAQREFTISQTTKDLIQNLDEPLLIRGYISERTHPLLAPLTPQVRDMLREYEIASGGKVQAEVVDPIQDEEVELEANQSYGIRPTPFRITGRQEASVINSYFDILVRYGDQSMVLSLNDLIEVEQSAQSVSLRLKNLEYDLTRAIKKVVYGFQSMDAVLSTLDEPVTLTLFITPSTFPQALQASHDLVNKVAGEIQAASDGNFVYNEVDPTAQGSPLTAQQLQETYGLTPYPLSLFSQESFFFHLLLTNGQESQVIYPPTDENPAEADVRTAIESAVKRTSAGFLKVVGVWSPSEQPTQDMFGNAQQPLTTYQLLRQQLSQEYRVVDVDLSSGQVDNTVDALLVVAPQNFTDMERFAIDQFLMRGTPVILAASPYKLDVDQMTGTLALASVDTGITPLLESYGVTIDNSVVMDLQNAAFPVAVNRDLGGFQVQEVQAVNYPFFPDIRPDGMNDKSMITANLAALSLNWASPVSVDAEKNAEREVVELFHSSSNSWITSSLDIQPDFENYPETGFAIGQDLKSYALGYSLQGAFESAFKGQAAPTPAADPAAAGQPAQGESQPLSVLEKSPDNARLVVIGSVEFLEDFALQLSANLSQDYYMNNLRLVQNAVNWAVEDEDLLAIRSRGSATHILRPLTEQQSTFWEVLSYLATLALLAVVYSLWQIRRQQQPIELLPVKKD